MQSYSLRPTVPAAPTDDKTRTVSFRIPRELFLTLAEAATAEHRSLNNLAVVLLTEAFEARHDADAARRRATKSARAKCGPGPDLG
jgi:hypothetical protein